MKQQCHIPENNVRPLRAHLNSNILIFLSGKIRKVVNSRNVLIFLLLLLAGCGTRKRAVQVETFKKDVKEVVSNDISSRVLTTRKSAIIIYSPLDATKPMVINGKEYVNTRIEENNTEVVKDSSGTDKSKTDKSESVKQKSKASETETRKGNPWLWLAIAIVACFGIWQLVRIKKPT